jgi:DNA-directed RNA polymerase specialized sigma24 family protein
MVGDPATASAVADSLFTDLPRTIASYDPSEMRFDAWILRLAAAAATERVGAAGAEQDSAPPSLPVNERRSGARGALWALPPDVRYVLVLLHLVGLSAADVAARLDKTEGAVRQLDERGRAALIGTLRKAARRSAVA